MSWPLSLDLSFSLSLVTFSVCRSTSLNPSAAPNSSLSNLILWYLYPLFSGVHVGVVFPTLCLVLSSVIFVSVTNVGDGRPCISQAMVRCWWLLCFLHILGAICLCRLSVLLVILVPLPSGDVSITSTSLNNKNYGPFG